MFIQLMVPRASFLGHLCGILAGMTYVHGGKLLQGVNLLRRQPSYTYARGTTGGGSSTRTRTARNHDDRAYDQAATANAEEEEERMVQEALRRSLEDYYDGPTATHDQAEYKQHHEPTDVPARRRPEPAHASTAPPARNAQLTPEEMRNLRLRRLGQL